jgi:hypothetical protein
MEAACSSELSVDFERTTRRSIPEDRIVLFLFYLMWIVGAVKIKWRQLQAYTGLLQRQEAAEVYRDSVKSGSRNLQSSNKDISYNACYRILIEGCPEVTGRLITVFRIFEIRILWHGSQFPFIFQIESVW